MSEHINDSQRVVSPAIEFNRRTLLASAGAILLAATSCGNRPKTALLPDEEVTSIINRGVAKQETDIPVEEIDYTYLEEIIGELQQTRGNTEKRVKAAHQSLRLMRQETGVDERVEYATAFQIDESGIYLTANHAAKYSISEVLSQFQLSVTNPISGEASRVQAALKHPRADVAIVYAPTGRSKKPTPDLRLNFDSLEDEEQLWMVGFVPRRDGRVYETVRTGHIDNSVKMSDASANEKYFPNFVREAASKIAVRGLIPVGGTSGSPIVNQRGEIVAIESGFFPLAEKVEEYEGAVVVPLSYLKTLTDQPALMY